MDIRQFIQLLLVVLCAAIEVIAVLSVVLFVFWPRNKNKNIKKRMVLPVKINFNNITNLREFVVSNEGQSEIVTFSESLHKRLNTEEQYLDVCRRAEERHISLTGDKMRELLAMFDTARLFMSPGHDGAHLDREGLATLALLSDPVIQNAAFQADLDAGILSAFLHDIGVALIPRYRDNSYPAGHCQIGAWYVYNKFEGILEENLLHLLCFGVDGHQHLLGPQKVADGEYTRQTHSINLFYAPKDTGKKSPVGMAVILPRFADRLENLGVTHAGRHILAISDAQSETGTVQDFDGNKYWDLKGDALNMLLIPKVRYPWIFPPSLIEWMVMVYGKSVFGAKPYSQFDNVFPVMDKLVDFKLMEVSLFKNILETESDYDSVDGDGEIGLQLKNFLRRINGSSSFSQSWFYTNKAWETLHEPDQARWRDGLAYLDEAYTNSMKNMLKIALSGEHPLSGMAQDLYDSVI